MLLDQFPFEDVASWLTEGQVIPFLGAGASRAGVSSPNMLPDGLGLATELINRMPGYPGQPAEGLARAAEYFELTTFDRPALFEYMHRRFYQQQLNAPLTRVAQLLATIPNPDNTSRFIVTTNYDNFIERAFHEAGHPLCVITQDVKNPEHGASQLSLRRPDGLFEQVDARDFVLTPDSGFPPRTTYLFKMHGSADRRSSEGDGLIITESDYVEFLVNSGGPLSFPPPSLLAIFSKRRFLFLGYSLADWNFRVFFRLLAIRNAISKSDLRRHWAIQLNPNPLDEKLWYKRNVNVYDGDLLEFCERLQTAWTSGDKP